MNEKYQEIVGRELSRKDFLKFIGGGIVVLLGMNNLITYVSRYRQTSPPKATVETSHSFGSRKFGV